MILLNLLKQSWSLLFLIYLLVYARQFHKEQLWNDTVKIMTALWTRVNQCIENGVTLIEGGNWTKYLMK